MAIEHAGMGKLPRWGPPAFLLSFEALFILSPHPHGAAGYQLNGWGLCSSAAYFKVVTGVLAAVGPRAQIKVHVNYIRHMPNLRE
jgi:hypothetical protein